MAREDQIRHDERHQTQASQAERARTAKDRGKRQVLAVIHEEASAGGPPKVLLVRVNDRLRMLGRNPISLPTLYRLRRELRK